MRRLGQLLLGQLRSPAVLLEQLAKGAARTHLSCPFVTRLSSP
jgi:hypothetical protein